MSAVVRRRTYELDGTVWVAAAALVLAYTLLTQVSGGALGSSVSHWIAYLLITGQISVHTAVFDLVAVLPWWVPITGWLISGLTWWAQFVVAFGWEGLGLAIAAISWTGAGALVVAIVGGALIG
jgi:hypothetical protein